MIASRSWDEAKQSAYREYLKLDTNTLLRICKSQMLKRNAGIPLSEHLLAYDPMFMAQLARDPEGMKLAAGPLSTTGGGALIRQDLEVPLYALFIKKFPWLDRLGKKPANGITHTAVQQTSPGNTSLGNVTIAELGTVNDDVSAYQRALFNVGVFAIRRGVSLKQQFATVAGGAGFNPETQEISAGVNTIANAVQQALLQGNSSYTTGQGAAATNEGGAYFPNAFDGLRMITGQIGQYASGGTQPSNSVIVDADSATSLGLSALPSNPITTAIGRAASLIADNGGQPSAVVMDMTTSYKLDQEQTQFLRINKPETIEVIPGVHAKMIETPVGMLPLIPTYGNPGGTYLRTSDGASVSDVYVVDETGLSIVYLGPEALTILEIPVGVNGQLSSLFIPFVMYGMEMAAPLWSAKVRVKR